MWLHWHAEPWINLNVLWTTRWTVLKKTGHNPLHLFFFFKSANLFYDEASICHDLISRHWAVLYPCFCWRLSLQPENTHCVGKDLLKSFKQLLEVVSAGRRKNSQTILPSLNPIWGYLENHALWCMKPFAQDTYHMVESCQVRWQCNPAQTW